MKKVHIITAILVLALQVSCGGGSTSNIEVTQSKFFFDINSAANLLGFGVGSNTATFNSDKSEFTVIGYDNEGNKVGEITFVDSDTGIAISKQISYRENSNVTVTRRKEGVHEGSSNVTEHIATWSPPLVIVPSTIQDGATVLGSDKEAIEWPNSVDSIDVQLCGGPQTLLTEWSFINHDREIQTIGNETIEINGESINVYKIVITSTLTNVPKSFDCNAPVQIKVEKFWLAEGKGVVRYSNIVNHLIGYHIDGTPRYDQSLNTVNGIFGGFSPN